MEYISVLRGIEPKKETKVNLTSPLLDWKEKEIRDKRALDYIQTNAQKRKAKKAKRNDFITGAVELLCYTATLAMFFIAMFM